MASVVAPRICLAGADKSYVLSNGLTVIMAPQPGSPVISARVAVKTGSAAEKVESEYGLAHLMEHMAFKGTKNRKVGEISSQVETSGGDINAYTNNDETVYYLDLPAESLELGLDILSDMVFFPSYDPEEYRLEKEVVVEEIKRAADNPERALFDLFFALSFPGHPYEQRVLGTEKSVREASRDLALGFHDRYYRPDNAVLVVTGGFDPDVAEVLVDKYYGQLKNPAEALLPVVPQKPGAVNGPVVRIINSDQVTVPKVVLGFAGLGARDSEATQADFLSMVLSQGRASRLVENVKIKKGLVSDVSSLSLSYILAGSFLITYESEPEKVIEALEAILEEISSLAINPPADDELSRNRVVTSKIFLNGQESAAGLSSQLASFEVTAGDWHLRDAFLAQLNRITSYDLVRLARKIFVPENSVLLVMLPEGQKIDEKKLKSLVADYKLPPSAETLSEEASFELSRLKNGSRLLVMRDATLPLVTVKVTAMGGLLAENEANVGLSGLMTEVWATATKKKSSEELSRAVENLGAHVSGFSGRNSVGLTGSFLSSNWRVGLDLFTEILTEPAFSSADLEDSRQETLAELKMEDEQLPKIAFRNLRKKVFGQHPYSLNSLGTIKTVTGFSPKDLEKQYQGLIRPDNLVFVVAGDVDPVEVKAALEENLKNFKARGAAINVKTPPVPKAISSAEVVSENLDRAQTHLAMAFLAPGLGHADQAALDILDAYLSGMGGLLFSELREKQSLAYTVNSGYNPGLGTGAFSFYIASDPTKTGQALSGILEIINSLKSNDLADDKLQGAIRYLSGQIKIRRQTLSARADQALFNELYGLGLDFDRIYLERLKAVTAKDIRRVAENYLKIDQAVLSLVGSEASVAEATAKFK